VAPDAIISGHLSVSSARGVVVNSNGVSVTRESTMIELSVHVIVRRDSDVGSYYDFDVGHRLEDVQFEGLGRNTGEKALRFLGAKKVAPAPLDIVLGPLAAFSFLQSLASACNAESVQRNRSYFAGRLGQKVAAKEFSLWTTGS